MSEVAESFHNQITENNINTKIHRFDITDSVQITLWFSIKAINNYRFGLFDVEISRTNINEVDRKIDENLHIYFSITKFDKAQLLYFNLIPVCQKACKNQNLNDIFKAIDKAIKSTYFLKRLYDVSSTLEKLHDNWYKAIDKITC